MKQTLPPSQDWEQYSAWPCQHSIKMVFNDFAQQVIIAKGKGLGQSPTAPTSDELTVLRENYQRLTHATVKDTWKTNFRDRWKASNSLDTQKVNAAKIFQIFSDIIGLTPGASDSKIVEREYLLSHLCSMKVDHWKDPAKAIIYAAAQAASHQVSLTCQGKSEVETSVALTQEIRANIVRVIDAINKEQTPLPPGSFLDFGSASMQGWKDWQGADFAVVVGTVVLGRPMYRVVLFQAKWNSSREYADISHKDGQQLDDILSTGMGYYVFYPKTFHGKAFITTVRSAEDTFTDVWGADKSPCFNVNTRVGRGQAAWDFALFLAAGMASSEDIRFGRLFPDEKSVAEALSIGRTKPLVHTVLAFDFSKTLNVHELVEQLKIKGFDAGDVECALSAFDAGSAGPDEPSDDTPDSFNP